MLKEYDDLVIKANEVDKLSLEERKARTKKRDELIKKMSDSEIKEILSRNIPPQYKEKVRKLRGM